MRKSINHTTSTTYDIINIIYTSTILDSTPARIQLAGYGRAQMYGQT